MLVENLKEFRKWFHENKFDDVKYSPVFGSTIASRSEFHVVFCCIFVLLTLYIRLTTKTKFNGVEHHPYTDLYFYGLTDNIKFNCST